MKIQLAALALTALFAAADACKCRDRFGQVDGFATKHCCDGHMKRDDCPKRSMPSKTYFHNCCVSAFKTNSDCPCKDCKPYEYCATCTSLQYPNSIDEQGDSAVEQDDSAVEQDD